jgi:hypothetical protein
MRTNERSDFKLLASVWALLLAAVFGISPRIHAEKLTTQTQEAFARYVRVTEARMDQELAGRGSFLWVDALPRPSRDQAYADLINGQVVIQGSPSTDSAGLVPVPGGLIHDWTGIVFIPGVSMSQVIRLLEDYEHASQHYGPQVVRSRLLEHTGNDFRVALRLKQVHIVTVVLDTEYNVHYTCVDATHAFSRSYSTRIAEVENAGETRERDMPVGDDNGFLWRLYSYWRFYQSQEGVFVQCDAISLTRNVPAGLGWLVRPFLETIPRDSLRFTLAATRNAVVKQVQGNLPQKSSCTGEKTNELNAKSV